MSAPINDGGPAFPHFKTDPFSSKVEICPQGGMTLRDYFAAAALTGIAAGHMAMRNESNEALAAFAFGAADAMLAARKATP
jgi:hypothetical protein